MLYPLSYEGPGSSYLEAGQERPAGSIAPVPRVLVIDDDPVIVELLRVNFDIEGFEVITADDGLEGLDRAKTDQPDVVLTDIMMPRLDGLGLVKRLRAEPRTRAVPIILVWPRRVH